MLYFFFIIYIPLQRAVSSHSLSQKHGVDNGLTVNGIADCRNNIPVFCPVFILEIKKNSPVIGGLHVIAGITLPTGKGLSILRRKKRHVQLPGLHLNCLRIVVGNNLKHNPVYIRAPFIIILIFHKRNRLPCVPAFQLIRPCAHRISEKIRLLHVLPFQKMAGQNPHSHIIKKRHIRRGKTKGNGVLIRHANLLHILIIRSVLRTVVRIHNGFYGKFHIIGGKRLPVMPLYPFTEVKSVCTGFLVKFPALCKSGNHLILSVMGRQTAK